MLLPQYNRLEVNHFSQRNPAYQSPVYRGSDITVISCPKNSACFFQKRLEMRLQGEFSSCIALCAGVLDVLLVAADKSVETT